jgi:hypothetical protein
MGDSFIMIDAQSVFNSILVRIAKRLKAVLGVMENVTLRIPQAAQESQPNALVINMRVV